MFPLFVDARCFRRGVFASPIMITQGVMQGEINFLYVGCSRLSELNRDVSEQEEAKRAVAARFRLKADGCGEL